MCQLLCAYAVYACCAFLSMAFSQLSVATMPLRDATHSVEKILRKSTKVALALGMRFLFIAKHVKPKDFSRITYPGGRMSTVPGPREPWPFAKKYHSGETCHSGLQMASQVPPFRSAAPVDLFLQRTRCQPLFNTICSFCYIAVILFVFHYLYLFLIFV